VLCEDVAYLTKIIEDKIISSRTFLMKVELIVSAYSQLNVKQLNKLRLLISANKHPKYRGQKFILPMYCTEITQKSNELGCKNSVSLVRAHSQWTNITLSTHGFVLEVSLYNKHDCPNRLESMNVWYCNIEFKTTLGTTYLCVLTQALKYSTEHLEHPCMLLIISLPFLD